MNRFYIFAHSSSNNSLGRALSMALTAWELGEVQVIAINDGKTWGAAEKFAIPVVSVSRGKQLNSLLKQIADVSNADEVVVWFSKGIKPLPRIAATIAKNERIAIIADFDDDDVDIMRQFRSQAFSNKVRLQIRRRLRPRAIARSQSKIASIADGLTYSSRYLADMISSPATQGRPMAFIPHTRRDLTVHSLRTDRPTRESTRLTVAFLGTVRSHKGIEHLVSLARKDQQVTMRTFHQKWTPPIDLKERWQIIPSSTPLQDAYNGVDLLVIPSDEQTPAALRQLPAKLVDAAVFSCAVAATPTPTLDEYANGSYIRVADWTSIDNLTEYLSVFELEAYGNRLRRVYDTAFSPKSTASALATLLLEVSESK